MTNKETIYVYLPNENVDVWRPVEAEQESELLYRIVSENKDTEDEKWEFSCGDLVRCEFKLLSEGNDYEEKLVAVEKINTKKT